MKTLKQMLKEIGYNDSPLRREVINTFKEWLQQKPFPNYNDAKYALPDGWTFEDQKDAMEIYIGDILKWKKEFLEELEQ